MAYYGFRTRRTYAADHRSSAPRRSGAAIYATEAGEGIQSQTCSGARQGFTTPVVQGQRADGSPLFFVESERFQDRYYGLYRKADGTWFFSGDAKLSDRYIAKVEAFIAGQQLAEVA